MNSSVCCYNVAHIFPFSSTFSLCLTSIGNGKYFSIENLSYLTITRLWPNSRHWTFGQNVSGQNTIRSTDPLLVLLIQIQSKVYPNFIKETFQFFCMKLGIKNEWAKFLRNIFIWGISKNVSILAHNLTMETWVLETSQGNAPTKYWALSDLTHIWKIRIFWNEVTKEKTFFLFPTVCIFGFCRNMNPVFLFSFWLINQWHK